MGKKGFTLIEVLSVVVLLGLLISLIVSNVKSSITDSKEAISEASATNLVDAFESYYFEAKLKGSFTGCSYNFDNDVNDCVGFSFTGEKPSGGVVSLSDQGVISGNLVFDKYDYNIVNNKVIKSDD